MLKKISTSLLMVAVVTLLLLLAFKVRIAATADSIAVLKTSGMTCSSCSSKISKALEKEKGVAVTEVDVAGGWVMVGYDTKVVQPEKLAQKVSETGFGSNVYTVLTPAEFKRVVGREIGGKAASNGCGGCGKNGGCGTQK